MFLDMDAIIENAATAIVARYPQLTAAQAIDIAAIVLAEEEAEMGRVGIAEVEQPASVAEH